TQAVEIHVGAAGDRDESAALRPMPLAPGLDARDRQSAGRLEHRARIFEHVLERGADRIGVDGDHVVDELPANAKRFLADLLDRDAVGEEPDVTETDAAPGRKRSR